jgi:polysaccharide export outer membrane protein
MSTPAPSTFSRTAIACVLGAALIASAGAAFAAEPANSLPPPDPQVLGAQAAYVIAPMDRISISVFQVPDLTLKSVQVDSTGRITVPLIGDVLAAGRTTAQLSNDIATQLSKGYLQNPQVSVTIDESASQKATVEGAVMAPGVFQVSGSTTLLQMIAMAKGPDKNADIRHVGIFRTIQGKRAAAVFDLKAIRKGDVDDPEVYPNDIVVVQGSGAKAFWQDLLHATPIIGLFRFL